MVRKLPKQQPEWLSHEKVVQNADKQSRKTVSSPAVHSLVEHKPAVSKSRSKAISKRVVGSDRSSAARVDYLRELSAWLEQHKEYLRRARIRRQQGTAVLRFTINREGRVLVYDIDESSGHSMLDNEVEAMIKRAQPLPAMPGEMQQASLEFVLPVQFFLR